MASKKTPLINELIENQWTMLSEPQLRRKTVAQLEELVDDAQRIAREAYEAAEETLSIWTRVWINIKAFFKSAAALFK